MPIYILMSTLTVQGVQTLKSNPDRLRAVNQDVEELGCKVLHQWATLGEVDFINVVEAPDEKTIARVSISLAARGSTKVRTLPALSIDEFLRAIETEMRRLMRNRRTPSGGRAYGASRPARSTPRRSSLAVERVDH